MSSRAVQFVLVLVLVLVLEPLRSPPFALAQAVPPGMPGAGPDDYVLGGLGVAGAPADAKADPAFTVREALAGGPCEGRLLEKDMIVGVDRKALAAGEDAVLAIEAAVERAEATATGDLELSVARGGKTVAVKVKVAPLGAHSKTCPKACKKCARVAAAGVAWLEKSQAADGSFPTDLGGANGKVVMTSLGGLALLAAGGAGTGADDPVKRAMEYVMAHIGKEDAFPGGMGGGSSGGGMTPPGGGDQMRGEGGANWSQVNWSLAYGGIFLVEAARALGSAPAAEKAAWAAQELAKNEEGSGGFAHGPGGPNALGYVELEILSDFALAELGLVKRLKQPVDAKQLARGLAYVEACEAGDGGVAYSTRPGQKGFGEAGRTAGAVFAFAMCGQRQSPTYAKLAGYLRAHVKELGTGHVSPTMHTLSGALATWQLGDDDFARYFAIYRPKLMAARGVDGRFTAVPTKETLELKSNTDRQCGPVWTTASDVIVLELAAKRLALLTDRK